MDKISLQEPGAFAEYLREYRNTICGRHPIGVLLNCLDLMKEAPGGGITHDVRFNRYEQSGQVTKKNDSSVSYASGIVNRL